MIVTILIWRQGKVEFAVKHAHTILNLLTIRLAYQAGVITTPQICFLSCDGFRKIAYAHLWTDSVSHLVVKKIFRYIRPTH